MNFRSWMTERGISPEQVRLMTIATTGKSYGEGKNALVSVSHADIDGQDVTHMYIKGVPTQEVEKGTPFNGITPEILEEYGDTIMEAQDALQALLDPVQILVGYTDRFMQGFLVNAFPGLALPPILNVVDMIKVCDLGFNFPGQAANAPELCDAFAKGSKGATRAGGYSVKAIRDSMGWHPALTPSDIICSAEESIHNLLFLWQHISTREI